MYLQDRWDCDAVISMPDANGQVCANPDATRFHPTFSRVEPGAGIDFINIIIHSPVVKLKIRLLFQFVD